MTSPDSSAAGAGEVPAAEAPTIRSLDCPWCEGLFPVSFFVEVWSGSYVHASGGHDCPKAPVQPLAGDGEAA